MELQIIKSRIRLVTYMTNGVKDKRFRSGYRVPPEPACNPIVDFTVKVDPIFRGYQTLQLWDQDRFAWGTYIFTEIDRTNNTASIRPVRTDYHANQPVLTIPSVMHCLLHQVQPGPALLI